MACGEVGEVGVCREWVEPGRRAKEEVEVCPREEVWPREASLRCLASLLREELLRRPEPGGRPGLDPYSKQPKGSHS